MANKNTHTNIICLSIIIFIILYLMLCEKRKNKEYFTTNNSLNVRKITGISTYFPDGVIDIGAIKTNIPTTITT